MVELSGRRREVPRTRRTALVAGTAKASATILETIHASTKREKLVGLTIANVSTGTSTQVFVGVQLAVNSGSTWDVMLAPVLDAGEFVTWEGVVYMAAGDKLVSYAGSTNVVAVTPAIEPED